MKTLITVAASVLALLLAGCGNDDEPSDGSESPAPAASSSAPVGESDECMAAVEDWLALYDAFEEATTLEDPTKEMAIKVRDDSEDLVKDIQASCGPRITNSAVVAHDQMLRVDGAVTACDFSDLCGSQVDDELDATMEAVDEVRALAES